MPKTILVKQKSQKGRKIDMRCMAIEDAGRCHHKSRGRRFHRLCEKHLAEVEKCGEAGKIVRLEMWRKGRKYVRV